jgi:Zn-dependent protease/predicted transcriptional regulator
MLMGTVGGLRLGRIAGIEVVMDWSLLIIFVLILVSLAGGVFPSWHPNWNPGLTWLTALGAAILFFISVLLHELSHALVGRRFGVSIRRITLFMFGGMAHMENEPPSWRAELMMALAGPLMSFALGILFGSLASLIAGPIELDPEDPGRALSALGPVATLLAWLAPINIILGAFNLVPGFPLDGGRVLRAIMWGVTGDFLLATRRASRAGQVIAWLLMAIGFLMIIGLRVPFFGTGLVSGLWLIFIGWFLNNAALLSYRQLIVRESLEGVPVSCLMQTRFTRVDPDMRISTLLDEHVMASGQRAFPVEQAGKLVGMVCVRDLHKRSRDAWDATTVREIMTPAEQLAIVSPQDDAFDVLALLGQRDLNQLPVVEDGRLLGLIRREDILKWLSLHTGPGQPTPIPT